MGRCFIVHPTNRSTADVDPTTLPAASKACASTGYLVSTFAGALPVNGAGTGGATNGTGTAARFSLPSDIVADSSGNFYVADQGNNRIRKITSAGVVTTLAGSTSGFTNATGTAAKFKTPTGLAISSDDTTLYVADSGNNAVRKIIISTGVVTTLAGQATAGFTNANGTSAQFKGPNGVTIDSSGNLYVADGGNNAIREIDTSGNVTTVAGQATAGNVDATGTAAKFNGPFDVKFSPDGATLYVSGTSNLAIRKIDISTGAVTTLGAAFIPYHLYVAPSGNIYGTSYAGYVYKYTPSGTGMYFASGGTTSYQNGYGSWGYFGTTGGLVGYGGNLYVADFGNAAIRKITVSGAQPTNTL